MNKVLTRGPVGTTRTVRMSDVAGATGPAFIAQVPDTPPARSIVKEKKIEDAVFGYMQAVRALGRTTINTDEIARALNLDLAAVDRTVSALRRRGVKTST